MFYPRESLVRWGRVAVIGSSLVFLVGAGCTRPSQGLKTMNVSLNGHPIVLELAQTNEEQRLGLGGRTQLPVDHGMLFSFPVAGTYPFWMKDMKIPIDLVWIKEQRIVGIERQLPPPREAEMPVTVNPPGIINRVLELTAGGADVYELKIGVRLPELP